jgi:transposase-like protein
VVIDRPTTKKIIHIRNLNIVREDFILILKKKIIESSTHSANESNEPKPMVTIIKKKKIHHTHGNGISERASG